jgi:ABC-2 type transport system permease protein
MLASMAMMFVFDIVLVGVGAAFGFDLHIGGLLALAVLVGLLMVTMASFSVAMALITKEISSFAAVINGINLPVMLLAGVLLPISLGPLWMRIIAHFNPLYYLVESARTLAAGSFAGPHVWQAFAVLTPMCVLVVAWATRVFRTAVS